MQKVSYFPNVVVGFLPILIISELRSSFVAIVTESAFSVTGIVTETLHPSKGSIVNNPTSLAKEKNKPLFCLLVPCQDYVTSLISEYGACYLELF